MSTNIASLRNLYWTFKQSEYDRQNNKKDNYRAGHRYPGNA